ncbi:serine protease inhibitor dipetalogastin-like [Colias croceus]|uniref:serine protease inhibitor dipetalogastin-like n=1 Tax=Colias crocea TaxID=72248 RepID=UPI001E281771|nr:serine protease inhibitor dipetalogastin-like [Colias croceus]
MWQLIQFFLCLALVMSALSGISPRRRSMLNRRYKMQRLGNETTEEPIQNCMCSKIYDPVCASNGKSYYNLCQMECENKLENVYVVHQGNCIPF